MASSYSPLAAQDRSPLMENKYAFIYIYTIWIPPVSTLRRSSYSVANPWIPSLPGGWKYYPQRPTAPLQLLVFRPMDTDTHTNNGSLLQ